VKNYTFEDVHFEFDRLMLRAEATRVLDEIDAMRGDDTLRLGIEGQPATSAQPNTTSRWATVAPLQCARTSSAGASAQTG
jgi:hypothetical protein